MYLCHVKPKFTLDIHGHILPTSWHSLRSKWGYGGFAELIHQSDGSANLMLDTGVFLRKIHPQHFTPQAILEDMNKHKVNIMVLSTIPALFNYWAQPAHTLEWSQFLNDHIATVQAEEPKRFIGLGTLPMQAPLLAIQEMERCIKELGLKGVQIGSNIHGINLDNPILEPFWAAAQDMQVPIFIHPYPNIGIEHLNQYEMTDLIGMPMETMRAMISMILGGVLERFPKLKIFFLHGADAFIFALGKIDHAFMMMPETCQKYISKKPSEYLGHFWIDSLTHSETTLKYLVEYMGHEKIAYGTDYPCPLGDTQHGALLANTELLTESQIDHIFWKTAFKFFNLQPAEYMSSFS